MIRTIFFDMGGVIINYDPALYARRQARSREEAVILEQAVFGSREWAMYDAGAITTEAFVQHLRDTVPDQLQDQAVHLLLHWYENMPVFEGMTRLIRQLHEKGYQLIVLSNAGEQFNLYKDRIEAFQYMDDFIISSYIQMVKPTPGIYQYAIGRAGHQPDECLFIDDSAVNIEAARACGMYGYCYADGDIEKLIAYLQGMGIL